MPTRERVEAFVALVEANRHVEAIEEFYQEDASMQENFAPPREGRARLVAREAGFLATLTSLASRKVGPALVFGDTVAINWIFEFTFADGRSGRRDEIAHQTWRGDRILRERFYYDPAQRTG